MVRTSWMWAFAAALALGGCDDAGSMAATGGADGNIGGGADGSTGNRAADGGAGESADCTTLTTTTGSITDMAGNAWTLATGSDGSLIVDENGAPAGYSDRVTRLVYVSHIVSQQNADGGWWSWTNGNWLSESDPTIACGGGHFTVSMTGFTDPSGHPWNMRGLNAGVQDALQGFGNVLRDYPGLTAIRLNCNPDGDSASSIDQVVQQYTASGVVVEVEDHADSANGDNVAWYQQMAQTYKTNARVFLETPNEPSASATAQNQIQIIQAIRAAGFANPIGLQPIGGYDFSNLSTVLAAVGTDQIYITPHIYYGGADPNGPANYVQGDIQTVQGYGLYPCIDEFGDALDGWHRDPYGPNVISSVIVANQSGHAGALFWAMDNGNHADGADSAFMTPDGGQLTSVGAGLQSWLR